jgi:hypothetical protein
MSMYVVVLSDIELGLIESLRVGTTLSGTSTGALSIPAALTVTASTEETLESFYLVPLHLVRQSQGPLLCANAGFWY